MTGAVWNKKSIKTIILILRRALIIAAFFLLTLLFLKNLDAVTDTYSGRRGLSFGKTIFRKKAPTTPLALSLAHYTMGIIYDNERATEKAIREYEAVLRSDPDISYVHTRLAADLFLLKKDRKSVV